MASTYKNRNSWARALLGTWFVIGGCATGGSFWGGEDISLLPRQSQDADQVITLQSNMNCQFFVDSQPLAKGKRVRIVVTRGSHQLVCKPDEYRAKEEYVQPPYDSYHPIGFTFLMEDKLQSVEKLEVEENRPPSDQRGVQVSSKVPMDYLPGANGKAWAVVIGIDEYKHAPRLKYAVADAKAVADMLGRQGFQVAALYNEQATRDAIERELGDRLVTRVGEQDRVVIFYAGHGETRTVRGGKTQGFLLPIGGQQDALAQTGISMGRIRELADALPSRHVLFLVDVCYGGVAGTQFRSLPKYTEEYLRVITRERGRQLITAGGADQEAMEGPEWGHSVFTYYLLEGVDKELADLNGDGIIPASELYNYLESRVFSAAQMKGHTQRPEMWSLAAEKGEFVFAPAKPMAVQSNQANR